MTCMAGMSHMRLRAGFSMVHATPRQCAAVTTSATNSYMEFALRTLALAVPSRSGSPSGYSSLLTGFGSGQPASLRC